MSTHTARFRSTPMMRALAACIRGNVPAILWGPPGCGKTATVESCGRAWQMHVETVIGSIREATDFLGLGVEVGGGAGTIGHVAYAPPRWAIEAAQAPRALVLFDELTTCPASVRKAMLRVMQERYAGDLKLPDTVAILAAANPPETAVDGYDLEPPTANRMIHLDFDFPADTWLDGLAAGFDHLHQPSIVELIGSGDDNHRATIRGAVTAFLRARRDLLDTDVPTDPTIAGRAWPSRRSWTNAITALAEVQAGDVEAQHLVLAGAVGEGPAREFFTFRATLDLPTPEEAIAQADTIRWARDASRPGVRGRDLAPGLRDQRPPRPDDLAWRSAHAHQDRRRRPARRGTVGGHGPAPGPPARRRHPRRPAQRLRRPVRRHRPLGRLTPVMQLGTGGV